MKWIAYWLIRLYEKMDDISDHNQFALWVVCSLIGTVIMAATFRPHSFTEWLLMPLGGMAIGYAGMIPLFLFLMLALRGLIILLTNPLAALRSILIAAATIAVCSGIIMFFMGILRGGSPA